MKKICLLLFCIGISSAAQIKGNKSIETNTYSIEGIETIKVNLYAKITIDQSANEGLSITADSNLFQYIGKSIESGILHIDQLKWIAPSSDIIISIGAPNLRRLEQGTHDTTRIVNLDNEYLQIMAPIGNIRIEGKTKELRIGAELATVDASKVNADEVIVNLWSYGKITVNPKKSLWADVSNNGSLYYIEKPKLFKVKTKTDGKVLAASEKDKIKADLPEFISFKIKNNSKNRNQFYVIGPKPDGSRFSYGFPMMPNSKRHENWTVGTKVYKVNSLGFRKLLVEITKEDEGEVVNLFQI